MFKVFSNESWYDSEEKESYIRTLKTLRFHKAIDRMSVANTKLIFVSRLSDPSIRQHFEESSRYFKTYNLFKDISHFFGVTTNSDDGKLQKTPVWLLDILDSALSVKCINFFLARSLPKSLQDHFSYRRGMRSLSEEKLIDELALLVQMIGLASFSRLNVFIGVNDDRNVQFGIRFLSRVLNNSKVKNLLSNRGIMLSEDDQTYYGTFKKTKNKLSFKTTTTIVDINKPLVSYLETKSLWVLDRKHVKDLIDVPSRKICNTLIIGRRILTRGHDPINENSQIQSYDFKTDADSKLIHMILKRFLKSFKQSNTNALIIIENYPSQISYLISRDEELRSLLHGNTIALACIEPETKDVFTFEGDQFIQKSLKQIY